MKKTDLIFPQTMIQTILDKSPWDSTAIFIFFSVISRFPHFYDFLVVLPPPTLYKVETRKKFWIHASNIVCWVRGGIGSV